VPQDVEQYQAWLIAEEGDSKVGVPARSEAGAWQEVHTTARLSWPDEPRQRRRFEESCRVGRVVPIHGAV